MTNFKCKVFLISKTNKTYLIGNKIMHQKGKRKKNYNKRNISDDKLQFIENKILTLHNNVYIQWKRLLT